MTRIACWQAACRPGGVPDFLRRLESAADRAAAGGARLLVTPEMSLAGYPLHAAGLAEAAEPVDGRWHEAVRSIARRTGVAIVYGWPERDAETVYNSVRLVSAQSREEVVYRKTHLFGEIDRAWFTAGDVPVVQAAVDGLRIGLLVCYDVEFPELVRAHALAGTQLLVVPTALMEPWQIVARTLVPARAFESQLYIAYTNWIGDRQALRFCGLSTIAAPDGRTIVAEPGVETLLTGEIYPEIIAAARRETTYLSDLRPGLYGASAAGTAGTAPTSESR
ncbi:putative amidohydrolase [Actinoplanes octamycinicus]|uniref:Putative amidohydrolase n=1 Tax=Actinoplanes octamycinicus TaxID=135948 RepID=A0A7W7M7Z1_9ACTN|nr:carbon-nitrogen hydrolase family protein [Actinoplanes octamycinicus]MBB4740387.1 putative amidohydrolase [Actinoplanes octamycinicus]GIE59648.1 hydrolase [Actinoplanes octamycinicus]